MESTEAVYTSTVTTLETTSRTTLPPVTTEKYTESESPAPVVSTPRTCRYIDVAIVLDISGSKQNSADSVVFAGALISQFTVTARCMRVSILRTSGASNHGVLFHLDAYDDTDNLLGNIRGLTWSDQSKGVLSQLRDTRRKVFNTANGDRGGARNVVVIVTDGASPDKYSGVGIAGESALALIENITVIVVAVGCSPVVRDHLAAIASDPSDKHIIDVANFESLPTALDRLTKLMVFYSSDGILIHERVTNSKVVADMTTFALKTVNIDNVTTNIIEVSTKADDGVTWDEPETSTTSRDVTPIAVSAGGGGRMGPFPGRPMCCVYVCAFVRACVRAYVRACVRVCVRACVCVRASRLQL